MNKTAQNHRFHHSLPVFQRHFQGCRAASEDGEEERRDKGAFCYPRKRGRALRRAVHFRRHQRLFHAGAEPLPAR